MPDLDQASCSRQRCQRSPCSRQLRSASLESQHHHPRDLLRRAAAVGAPATGPQWASLLWPRATLLLHLALPLRHQGTPWMCLDRRLPLGGWGRSHSGQSPQQPYLLQAIWAVLSRQASPQLNRILPPAPGNAAVPERLEALRYQRIKKPKKSSKGSSKSKKRSDGSASQAQQLPSSQVLWPDEAVCLRKKKRHSRPDPFARLSDLCHRQLPEDQTAILNSVDHDDPGHATLL